MSYNGDIIARIPPMVRFGMPHGSASEWHFREYQAMSDPWLWPALCAISGPVSTARCSSLNVSIARVKALTLGGYKLEQETWMDVVFAGSRCLRQQFAGHGRHVVWQLGPSGQPLPGRHRLDNRRHRHRRLL